MITVLADIAIEDINKFISIFATTGADTRQIHGSKGSQVYKTTDDNQRVLVLLDWESRKAFEGFLKDPVYPDLVRSAGLKRLPTYTFLEKVCQFPH